MDVPLAGLPAALQGFTIVQLTDLHLGETLGKEWLRGVVAEVRALQPDLVAITGDLVDSSPDQLGRFVNRHEVARHVRVGQRHRAAGRDLFLKQRHD